MTTNAPQQSATTFCNATVFTGTALLPNATVRVANGQILAVSATLPTDVVDPGNVVDLAGDYLVPGFVDVQLYGGSDRFLNADPTPDTVRHLCDTHRAAGTTSVIPTLYSTSQAVVWRAIEAVRAIRREQPHGVLGLHVEGPYLNPGKRGAHSAHHVRPPDTGELAALFERGHDVIRLLTLAPEVFPAPLLHYVQTNKPAGLHLSLGHSNATYRQASDAFGAGLGLVTHLYNAMRGFESREPGVVGAVFDHPTVSASLITDGFHVDPVAIRLAYRLLGPDRLFLISDATLTNPTGPAKPHYAHDDFVITYENGRYLNPDGRLAGSSITLLHALRFCVHTVGIPLADALRMATATPANRVGFGDRLGRIAPGYVANLVRLDRALHLRGVWT